MYKTEYNVNTRNNFIILPFAFSQHTPKIILIQFFLKGEYTDKQLVISLSAFYAVVN